jgi:hypothetical protein
MNLWIKRFLGGLPLIGCGAGFTAIAVASSAKPMNVGIGIFYAIFALYYLAGAVAGMMLLEGRRHALTLNFFYWLVQTVYFYSFVFSYILWAPFNLGAWWNLTSHEVGWSAQVGSTFYFALFHSKVDTAVGINALAVACCAAVFVEYRRTRRLEEKEAERVGFDTAGQEVEAAAAA